MLSFVQLQ
jgi:hypothetical protein